MNMTLDYNVELFPLVEGQSFAMALASSLIPSGGGDGVETEDKDRDIWRPDGKGVKGLEEEYDYVMYGKVSKPCQGHGLDDRAMAQVYKFDGGGEVVYVSFRVLKDRALRHRQNRIRVLWRPVIVTDRFFSAYGWHRSR